MVWTPDNLKIFAAGLAIGGKYNKLNNPHVHFPPGAPPPIPPLPPVSHPREQVWRLNIQFTVVSSGDMQFSSASTILGPRDYIIWIGGIAIIHNMAPGGNLNVYFIVEGTTYVRLISIPRGVSPNWDYNFTSANSSRILRVHPDKSISIAGVHCPPGHFGVRIVVTSGVFSTWGTWDAFSCLLDTRPIIS